MAIDSIVNKNLLQAHTLPQHLYTDPQHWAWERKTIFSRSWQYVGDAGQVASPGQYLTTEVDGEPILIVRGQDGVLRAFYNVCPHRGSILCQGAGQRKVLQCPYHAWTFGLDGRLLHARNFEDVEGFDPVANGLLPVGVEQLGPLLLVNLDGGAPKIATQMPQVGHDIESRGLSGLVRAHSMSYEIKSNWKIVIDNFLECYHCAVAHPSFVDRIDMSEYTTEMHDYYSLQRGPVKGTDEDSLFYWLWPNFMINIYPGPGVSVNHIMPLGLDRTLAVFDLYFPTMEIGPVQEDLIAFVDQVQTEDTTLCENVQIGMTSRAFRSGRFAAEEILVHHFHRLMQTVIQQA